MTPISKTMAAALLALVAASCGSVSTSRETARDQATTATCDRLMQCGNIGDGKAFSSYDNCKIMEQSFWEGHWDAATCDNKIDGANLTVCLSAISATDCGNGLDLFATLAKCDEAKVCDAASSPDGG
ncbi:MAG TPA: DUF6184 family natural product biosynthesis lipoprotein [Polyangia bacterium]|nr:DUF6184 family natural product biosynthesis lipoprotein [Polyangia bacterium]